MRHRLLRLPVLLAFFAAVGCVMFAGCDLSQSGSAGFVQTEDPEPKRLRVNVALATPSKSVLERSIVFGTVKPSRSSSLGFARGGRVARVRYSVGDYIAEGETIAELEQDELVGQQERLDKLLEDAEAELSTYQARNNPQQIARVQNEIDRLNLQQNDLRRELAKGLIFAPYRAQLVEGNAAVGDMVPSGRPFFRIHEDVLPVVEVNLPSSDAGNASVGDQVWIKHDGELRPVTVATKSPELDPSSRTQRITLRLANSEADVEDGSDWTYGEVVEVHFWSPSDMSGFWVPYSALQREANGLWSTYVIEGEGEKQMLGRRIVEVVQLELDYALVKGSLTAGDRYVVDGLNRLVPGQQVASELVQREFTQSRPAEVGE